MLLGLRLGRHVDGLVDAYIGPDELSARVAAEEPTPIHELVEEADALVAATGDGWLRDQLVALRAYAGVLAGEPISYADEVERCYGVRPVRVAEDVYAEAHEQLSRLLPGDGSLAERRLAWKRRHAVPVERLVPALRDVVADLRARAGDVFGLPEGEGLTIEEVRDEPWWAFNYYGGNLTSRVIERPIMTTLVTFAILLFGVVGFRALPVAALPSVDYPTIQVSAALPGASPETMASSIATPLEREFSTIAGVRSISSSNTQGGTTITIQFALDRDIDAAAQDVQSAIAQAILPPMPRPPSYAKQNPSEQPIIYLALTSSTLPLYTVNEYADTMIAQRMSLVSGVSRVQIYGAQKYAVRIQVDPDQLAAHQVGIDDVQRAVQQSNMNLPTGRLRGEASVHCPVQRTVDGSRRLSAPDRSVAQWYPVAARRAWQRRRQRRGQQNDRMEQRTRGSSLPFAPAWHEYRSNRRQRSQTSAGTPGGTPAGSQVRTPVRCLAIRSSLHRRR